MQDNHYINSIRAKSIRKIVPNSNNLTIKTILNDNIIFHNYTTDYFHPFPQKLAAFNTFSRELLKTPLNPKKYINVLNMFKQASSLSCSAFLSSYTYSEKISKEMLPNAFRNITDR